MANKQNIYLLTGEIFKLGQRFPSPYQLASSRKND